MKQARRLGFIDQESYVAQYLALAIFSIGVVSTIGSDDLLAAFAAGECRSYTCEHDETRPPIQDLQLPGMEISRPTLRTCSFRAS